MILLPTIFGIVTFKFYKEYVSVVYSIALEEAYKEAPDFKKFNELNTQYVEKEKVFDEKFKTAQEKFAEFYHFTLDTKK